MPIYDYVCSNCRHLTEVIHGIHDDGPRFCPACGAEGTMRKALTTPTVHYRGSGWAKKDRSSSSGTRTKASASSANDTGGSAAKGAPTKGSPERGAAESPSSSSTDASGTKED